MLSFSSVAEAYRPDPPSPAGVNFFLTNIQWLRVFAILVESGERFQVKLHVIRKQNKYTFEKKNNLIICCFQDCWMKVSAGRLATVLNRMGTGSRDQIKLEVRRGRRDQSEIHRSGEQTLVY